MTTMIMMHYLPDYLASTISTNDNTSLCLLSLHYTFLSLFTINTAINRENVKFNNTKNCCARFRGICLPVLGIGVTSAQTNHCLPTTAAKPNSFEIFSYLNWSHMLCSQRKTPVFVPNVF